MAALFYDHAECRNSTSAARFLGRAKSEDDQDLLAQLSSWADSLIRRACGSSNHVDVAASTPSELLENLQFYSTDMEDEDGLPA
ncbi:Ras-related protein Rab-2 [Teratosphaeria destructans]|uniref:Ras-related protein Rab-2 n=1 Tax=Teratosphaeria destructans TaxID=418781 RepID=A0A9W7T1C0_9PEZI|nr:Ras-related protein Rab-2 [Teratosphaeria destructans]